jgi:hypothetical protein
MSLGKGFLVLGVACLALFTRLVAADETAPAAAKGDVAAADKEAKPPVVAAPSAAAGESTEQLIEQLDSAEFDKREAACGKLAAKGKAAIAALEKAAVNGDLEVSSRAATVLGKLLKSSDEATAKAATEALHRLAEGDSPAAARKAKSILEKKDGVKNNPQGTVVAGTGFGGQIIINGGMLNIGGGAMKTMSVKNVNGVKEINVAEDGKTVKIVDDPAQGIKVEMTEKQNGKDVTKKYEAKNVEELKKKLPAGYEIYKKYGEQGGNGALQVQMGIQIGGGNLPLPALPPQPGQLLPNPAAPAPPSVAPAAALPADNQQVDVATKLVKHLATKLEQLQKAEACKSASPEAKAELRKQIDELSKRLSDVRGQLGDGK